MESKIEDAARAAHEINRVYCREVLDDDTKLAWKDVPDWQRRSIVDGVEQILQKPDMKPAESHMMWMDRKASEGWVYGPEINPDIKTHPCFMAYDHLPLEQRVKDTIFGVVVRAALGIEHTTAIDVHEV